MCAGGLTRRRGSHFVAVARGGAGGGTSGVDRLQQHRPCPPSRRRITPAAGLGSLFVTIGVAARLPRIVQHGLRHMPRMPWRPACHHGSHSLGRRRFTRTRESGHSGHSWQRARCLRSGHGNGRASAVGHVESQSGDHRGCVRGRFQAELRRAGRRGRSPVTRGPGDVACVSADSALGTQHFPANQALGWTRPDVGYLWALCRAFVALASEATPRRRGLSRAHPAGATRARTAQGRHLLWTP